MEEIKEVELRSRRGKFIYNRTYDPVGLNKSFFSTRSCTQQTTDEEVKIVVNENTESEALCMVQFVCNFCLRFSTQLPHCHNKDEMF